MCQYWKAHWLIACHNMLAHRWVNAAEMARAHNLARFLGREIKKNILAF